jgi:hypothetical protein
MMATWFQGSAEEFIRVSREGFERGVRILHFLGGTSNEVAGDARGRSDEDDDHAARAGARRGLRRRLHRPLLRLPRAARRDAGGSCCASRSTSRIGSTQSIPAASLTLDAALLERFPVGYRHLAYLQTQIGYEVKPDMPGLTGPAVEQLYRRGARWLAGE